MVCLKHPLNPSTPSPLPGACVPATAGTHAELLVYMCDICTSKYFFVSNFQKNNSVYTNTYEEIIQTACYLVWHVSSAMGSASLALEASTMGLACSGLMCMDASAANELRANQCTVNLEHRSRP